MQSPECGSEQSGGGENGRCNTQVQPARTDRRVWVHSTSGQPFLLSGWSQPAANSTYWVAHSGLTRRLSFQSPSPAKRVLPSRMLGDFSLTLRRISQPQPFGAEKEVRRQVSLSCPASHAVQWCVAVLIQLLN